MTALLALLLLSQNFSAPLCGTTELAEGGTCYSCTVAEEVEAQVCYLRCSGTQRLNGSLTIVSTLTVTGATTLNGGLTTGTSTSVNFGANGTVNIGTGTCLRSGSSSSQLFNCNIAPTISSGFGTSPSIASSNGTAAFTVNVGSTASASGVIALPTAVNGWVCDCQDITTTSATTFITKQTASSTTTCTIGNFTTAGASGNWTANDILKCTAAGH